MTRTLLRMQRPADILSRPAPPGYRIDRFEASAHHDLIPEIYASAFAADPWSDDWDSFDEFDPAGVFVARDSAAQRGVGFSICFRRADFGYVSVVAVDPGHQRQGLASALVSSAVGYLRSRGLTLIRIDTWEDSTPAVLTYQSLGFEVYESRLEED